MATSKKQSPSAPPEIVEAYKAMVASVPEVKLKGATMPNTSWNGNMFTFVHPSGAVALRLPKELREEFIEKFGSKLFDAYGIVQKEYVDVPPEVLSDPQKIDPYFAKSWEYVQTLKPKKDKG